MMDLNHTFVTQGEIMQENKKKREMVPMYSAADFFAGKKDARPTGWMSNPDEIGPVLVDRETLFRLMAERRPVRFRPLETEGDKNEEEPHA